MNSNINMTGQSLGLDLTSSIGVRRVNGRSLVVRAGKPALCLTKRNRSRKSLARTHGFRRRMRTTSGKAVLKRRRAKGRKILCTKSYPNSGKGSWFMIRKAIKCNLMLSRNIPCILGLNFSFLIIFCSPSSFFLYQSWLYASKSLVYIDKTMFPKDLQPLRNASTWIKSYINKSRDDRNLLVAMSVHERTLKKGC